MGAAMQITKKAWAYWVPLGGAKVGDVIEMFEVEITEHEAPRESLFPTLSVREG